MKRSVHYVVDRSRISEDRADVRRALKQGLEVVKATRIEYDTGETKVIVASLSTITKPKDV